MKSIDIIELLDPRITSISAGTSNEKLIDVKTIDGLRCGPPPESPETEPHYCFLREGVIKKLLTAQELLPTGLYFRLYEGYRHPNFQAKLFAQHLERIKSTHPTWNEGKQFNKAAKIVSPIATLDGQAIISPHSTGGAIDIEIVDESDQPINFGMEIKDWPRVTAELIQTGCNFLDEEAKTNRKLLIDVLSLQGFVNYPREWWHFSYGDKYWAYLTGQQQAIYSSVTLP